MRKHKTPKPPLCEPVAQSPGDSAQNAVVTAETALLPATPITTITSPPAPPNLTPPATAQRDDPPNSGKAAKTQLNETEKARLTSCEQAIEKGHSSFGDLVSALAEIRDQRLHRAQFKSFGPYCVARWGYSRSHANRLADCARVLKILSPYGDKSETPLPTGEYQIRPLINLSHDQVAAVWERAVKLAKDKAVSPSLVRQAVAELLGRPNSRQGQKAVLRVPLEFLQHHTGSLKMVLAQLQEGKGAVILDRLKQDLAGLRDLLDAAGTPPAAKATSENNQAAQPTA